MVAEYLSDMTFVLTLLIGSLVALLFVYVKKAKKKRPE
ncbi:EYxxD motif small membrane protein [Peribacillus saganii]|nr:EYxxD motif small membrane protein [Peribacillus saganii]